MGFFDALRLNAVIRDLEPAATSVEAAEVNYVAPFGFTWTPDNLPVTRAMAMSVPAIARARNIMCGTVGMLPIERYSAVTGKHLSSIPLYYQPDQSSPRSTTYTWLADSIFFYGIGYAQVLEAYAEDNRPSRMRWIDPLRVTPVYSTNNTMVLGYQLDGIRVPDTGVGSLIQFTGTDEGLLNRAGRTITTAIELENAALRAAREPLPTSILSSTGMDLTPEKRIETLTAWREARRLRATAYLPSGLKLDTVGFDPKSQQLVEARAFITQEIARAVSLPAWYLNAETASMTYSNTEQERRTLIDFSVTPMLLKPIEDRLSMLDVAPRGVQVRFDLEEFLRGSAMERVDITLKLLDAGLITIDEAKAREDLSPEGRTA